MSRVHRILVLFFGVLPKVHAWPFRRPDIAPFDMLQTQNKPIRRAAKTVETASLKPVARMHRLPGQGSSSPTTIWISRISLSGYFNSAAGLYCFK